MKKIPKGKIKNLVKQAHKKGLYGNQEVWKFVKNKLPVSAFESHETAHQDMENYTEDMNDEIS